MSAGGTLGTIIVATVAALGAHLVLRSREPRDRVARTLLVLLVGGLAVGTSTHVENLVRTGIVPRPELPLAYNLFWSSLVVIDPLVAAVLIVRPRIGVVLVVALMAVDLAVNMAAFGLTPPVVAQLTYAALALIAVPVVRRVPRVS